jgi:hypothetical protein
MDDFMKKIRGLVPSSFGSLVSLVLRMLIILLLIHLVNHTVELIRLIEAKLAASSVQMGGK